MGIFWLFGAFYLKNQCDKKIDFLRSVNDASISKNEIFNLFYETLISISLFLKGSSVIGGILILVSLLGISSIIWIKKG